MKKLLIIFAVLLLLAVAATVAGILLSEGTGGPGLGAPTVLVWRVEGALPERAQPDLFAFPQVEPASVASLYRGFRRGLEDPQVEGLALYVRNTGFGLAKAQEMRRQLRTYSEAGKFVECYFETVGEGTNGTLAYFLATGCDRISMSPLGAVNLLGIYADALFFRGTLDKLEIEPEFFTVGEYKSAGEQFTRTGLSDEAQEAIEALVDGQFELIVEAVAEARGLGKEEVLGLVDELAYPDEFRRRLEELAGGEPRLVRVERFGSGTAGAGLGGRRIAVVFALGTIIRGGGGPDPWTQEMVVGSDQITDVLRRLREDSSIPAVVLRIDSPGGSAIASDLILREVELLAEEKPVVVSMSDVAASGGYYIAAKASRIVAEEATLTGSIGVVAGRFATAAFEREKLGITRDSIARGANAGLWRDPSPMGPERTAELRATMQPIYDAFVGHVAAGRGMGVDEVDRVARGRVWLGRDAHRLGLVDELGGIDRAVDAARELAGIGADEDLRLVFYPPKPGFFELLVEDRRPLLPAALADLAKRLKTRPPGALELPRELAGLSSPR